MVWIKRNNWKSKFSFSFVLVSQCSAMILRQRPLLVRKPPPLNQNTEPSKRLNRSSVYWAWSTIRLTSFTHPKNMFIWPSLGHSGFYLHFFSDWPAGSVSLSVRFCRYEKFMGIHYIVFMKYCLSSQCQMATSRWGLPKSPNPNPNPNQSSPTARCYRLLGLKQGYPLHNL